VSTRSIRTVAAVSPPARSSGGTIAVSVPNVRKCNFRCWASYVSTLNGGYTAPVHSTGFRPLTHGARLKRRGVRLVHAHTESAPDWRQIAALSRRIRPDSCYAEPQFQLVNSLTTPDRLSVLLTALTALTAVENAWLGGLS